MYNNCTNVFVRNKREVVKALKGNQRNFSGDILLRIKPSTFEHSNFMESYIVDNMNNWIPDSTDL